MLNSNSRSFIQYYVLYLRQEQIMSANERVPIIAHIPIEKMPIVAT